MERMMDAQLGFIRTGAVTAIRSLSESELVDLKADLATIRQFSADQQLFSVVQMNAADVEEAVARYLQHLETGVISYVAMEATLTNGARVLLNFLSSVRTFLDHSEHLLSARYGKDSDRFKRFSAAQSAEYDGSFAYRFLYRLRNYAQHRNIPLHAIKGSSSAASGGKIAHSAKFSLSTKKLLQEPDIWGVQVKGELEALTEDIDIKPLVFELITALERLRVELFRDDIEKLRQAADRIEALAAEVPDRDINVPCLLDSSKASIKSGGTTINMTHLPLHVVRLIRTTFL